MRKVNIPIFQTTLKIYKEDEREQFEKDTGGKMPDEFYGCSCAEKIWVSGKNIGVCYHEATHFADWLIEERLQIKLTKALWDHTELRAYIVQYVGDKVREYCYD